MYLSIFGTILLILFSVNKFASKYQLGSRFGTLEKLFLFLEITMCIREYCLNASRDDVCALWRRRAGTGTAQDWKIWNNSWCHILVTSRSP